MCVSIRIRSTASGQTEERNRAVNPTVGEVVSAAVRLAQLVEFRPFQSSWTRTIKRRARLATLLYSQFCGT